MYIYSLCIYLLQLLIFTTLSSIPLQYFKCKWFDFGWLIGGIVAAFVLILILFVIKYMDASHRIAELEKRLKRNDDALLTPEERREANAGLSAAERMAEYSTAQTPARL